MYFHFSTDGQEQELVNDKTKWTYDWINSGDHFNKILGEFKKLNFFVGSNNSGKSRFLRALVKANPSNITFSKSKSPLSIKYQEIISSYSRVNSDINFQHRPDLNLIYNKIKPIIPIEILTKNDNKIQDSLKTLNQLMNKYNNLYSSIGNMQIKTLVDYLSKISDYLDEANYVYRNKYKNKKYIPILRSIQENEYLKDGHFKQTVKNNYGIEKNVFTGIDLYKQVLNLKTSNSGDRKKVKKFEEFLSNHFFNSKLVEITSNSKSKKLLLSIDDVEHHIYDVGDGIQSLIILLFPIFTADKNDWFLIEEPEANIHPGLQRIFIQTLLQDDYLKEKNLKYFFTTHSNHFLDITLHHEEIAIFQFQQNDKSTFKIKPNVKPNKDILDVLGVNTSSVFLANTSIWIEGPTDRMYISKMLKLLFANKSQFLKEDIDFSFFEYGGNLIQHYLFDNELNFDDDVVREKINSFSLSNKIYLLADNDDVDMRSAKGKRRKLLEESAKKNNNFLYQNTELKEIENLLPKVIIKDFLKYLTKNLEDIKVLEDIEFTKSDYDKVGLGKFYETLLLDNNIPKKNHKAFKADSGTLKNDYKIKLADFVINSEYKYEDFIENNEILEKIIENLYKFIKK